MARPDAAAAAVDVGSGRAGIERRRPVRSKLPPLPRPDGAPPLNSHSTPKLRLSVSVHLRDRHLDHHLPRRHVELFQRLLDERILRRGRDDEDRVLVLVGDRPAYCARCRCLLPPMRAQRTVPAAAPSCRRHDRAGTTRIGVSSAASWNVGGRRSCPPACPARRVGAAGAVVCVTRPVNACCSSGRDALGALVLQVVDIEAHAFAARRLSRRSIHFFASFDVRGVRRNHEQCIHPLDRDDPQNAGERARVRSPISLSSSCKPTSRRRSAA